jgi:NOL1/NOP2/fmu family ribosome biogenesis protein
MAQPLDKAQFDALMARAGLDLTEAEKEGIRAASAHTQAAAARVRTPREVSVESATIFTLRGASA